VSTNGVQSNSTSNYVTFKFSAMVGSFPETKTGAQFLISAGIGLSNDSYIWISQIPVKIVLTGKVNLN